MFIKDHQIIKLELKAYELDDYYDEYCSELIMEHTDRCDHVSQMIRRKERSLQNKVFTRLKGSSMFFTIRCRCPLSRTLDDLKMQGLLYYPIKTSVSVNKNDKDSAKVKVDPGLYLILSCSHCVSDIYIPVSLTIRE